MPNIKGPLKVKWGELRAAASAIGNVAEAARLAAINLPEYQQKRFVERVNKQASRDAKRGKPWVADRAFSAPVVQPVQSSQPVGQNSPALVQNQPILTPAELSNRVQSGKDIIDGTTLTLLEKRQYLKRALTTPLAEIDENSDLCVEMTETTTERGTFRKVKKPSPIDVIAEDSKLAGHYPAGEDKLLVGIQFL